MRVKGFLICIVVVFATVSCATIFSGRSYVMSISSDLPDSEVVINNANRYQLPADVVVTRSSENLHLTILQNDTVINNTALRPRLSNAFWVGNLFLYPLGHLIDLTNDNRFTYGQFIHIDSRGNVQKRSNIPSNRFSEYQQGDFNILLALPYINFFHLNPQNETPRNFGGIVGFGIGFEYFYRNSRSLQFRVDVMVGSPIIVPFPGLEISSAININLTDNFHINRFRLGYGLNLAGNTLYQLDGGFKTNNMLGLALSTHFRFTNRFYLGVIYRPSFFELSRRNFLYEHTISIDFKWKIPL